MATNRALLLGLVVGGIFLFLSRPRTRSTRTASGVDALLPRPGLLGGGPVQGVDFDIDPDTGSIIVLRQRCGCNGSRLLMRQSRHVHGGGIATVFQDPQRRPRPRGVRFDSTGHEPRNPIDPISRNDIFGGQTRL